MLHIKNKRWTIVTAFLLVVLLFANACASKKEEEPAAASAAAESAVTVSASSAEAAAEATPAPVEKTPDVKDTLDRIAAGEITNYTISSLKHGPLEPEGTDPAPYLDVLRSEATFETRDADETPDGEYLVLAVPDENIRFDFLPNYDGKNYIRAVENETEETLFLAQYKDTGINTYDVMSSWYQALEETHHLESDAEAEGKDSPSWLSALASAKDEDVTQIVVVAGEDMDSSKASVSMHYRGTDGNWKEMLSTDGVIGMDGMCQDADHVEGAFFRTPIGVYRFNKAFGIADDPGCQLDYEKVDENMYWSGDDRPGMPYNQLVDIRKYPELDTNASVHIVDREKEYQYCLNISFNEDATPGKGSAIFLYTKGENDFTGGGVAIPAEDMMTVMQMVNPSCVVVIDTMDTLGIPHEKKEETPAPVQTTEYTAYDVNGQIQGKLVLHDDGYYYSNDGMRYRDNGDGSYYGVDTGDTLYNYDPTA